MPFLRCQGQKSGTAQDPCPLHRAPLRGVGRPPKPTTQPPPLSPCLRNQPALPRSNQGTYFLFLAPSCFSRSRNKTLPECLIWLLIKLYWLKSPRTWVANSLRFLSASYTPELELRKLATPKYQVQTEVKKKKKNLKNPALCRQRVRKETASQDRRLLGNNRSNVSKHRNIRSPNTLAKTKGVGSVRLPLSEASWGAPTLPLGWDQRVQEARTFIPPPLISPSLDTHFRLAVL